MIHILRYSVRFNCEQKQPQSVTLLTREITHLLWTCLFFSPTYSEIKGQQRKPQVFKRLDLTAGEYCNAQSPQHGIALGIGQQECWPLVVLLTLYLKAAFSKCSGSSDDGNGPCLYDATSSILNHYWCASEPQRNDAVKQCYYYIVIYFNLEI